MSKNSTDEQAGGYTMASTGNPIVDADMHREHEVLVETILSTKNFDIELLRTALEFYAAEKNYYENPNAIIRNTFVGEDRGKLARATLARWQL